MESGSLISPRTLRNLDREPQENVRHVPEPNSQFNVAPRGVQQAGPKKGKQGTPTTSEAEKRQG